MWCKAAAWLDIGPVKRHCSPLFTGRNFEAIKRCGFLLLETYSVFHNSVLFIFFFFFFFNSKILCFVRGAKLLRNFKWLSCKVSSVTLWNASEVTILEQERCGFLHFEVYLVMNNSLFLFFFKWEILRFIRELFSFFFFRKIYFFFLKRIICSKYKQQGIVKVLISYQIINLQCSIFKIVICNAFLINTKILGVFQKNYASYKKNPTN